MNSGCCAGARFQVGKVPPISPASVFASTVRQTAEKSNVFFWDVASNTVSGTAAIAGREDGAPASSVVASLPGALHSADDGADGDFTGALMGRATLAGAGHSADGGEAGDFPGALMVWANLAGAAHSAGACIAQACGGEHSSVPARSLRVCGGGHSAVRARCGAGVFACGLGVPCLRRQARSRQRSFVRTSDDSSLSSLHFESLSAAHAFPFRSHPPLFGRAHGVDVMNSCGDMHDARVNSFGLHSARGNSGRHINSYRCTSN